MPVDDRATPPAPDVAATPVDDGTTPPSPDAAAAPIDDGTTPPTPPTLHLVSAGVSLPTVTLGAAAILADADVVLYDDLASHALPLVRAGATLLPVGKRGGGPSTPQADTSALAAACAKARTVRPPPDATAGYAPTASAAGVRRAVVVRLKSGDAGVYGRAAEEVGAVVAAGVAVAVHPGVCSVTAAAAAAGLPLTVRGVSDAFVVASGHAPGALDYGVLASVDTVVLLMATRCLPTICGRLVGEGGRAGGTPIAVIRDGGGDGRWEGVSLTPHGGGD
ncbi:hypothetical protein BU14_0339s0022 [Porphyra umbilicalis]|uniref:uroporphyrinogen-III C-methyltransferase n=1 Tax=Porphyra umbilicalis TaxID=2786 RepID=A0A1X6NY83_PORUM|nr:hypothetical protein BU14_0339s0022 [Porphyra umbilicalis]|eukprot:OSX73558.1 hypothetical protein BU14_0339s0022 [Porphyra umbilicalis]